MVSYTYGVMPPFKVFKRQVLASAEDKPEPGETYAYPMELVDDAEIEAVQEVLASRPNRTFTEGWTRGGKYAVTIYGIGGLYGFVEDLTEYGERHDHEDVLNLASSILYTLDIEWV